MASESVSSLILFIAAILVAAGVAGTLVTNVNQLSESIDDHSVEVSEGIDTDIEVISDPGSDAIYDESTENVTLYVKNTGERTLSSDPSGFDVLVNGTYVPREEIEVTVLEGEHWQAGRVVELEFEVTLDDGEHRISVGVDGDKEVFEFYHG